MKSISKNKGFTLVELLISMAVLTILIVAFTTFFSWNTTSIFETGERDKALANAENVLEELFYKEDQEGYFTNGTYLEELELVPYEEVADYKNRDRNIFVEPYSSETENGYSVTVVVFYQNGQRHVTISSFIEADIDE
ncbi:hypothetical protein JCM14036_34000 [Desulfotomaculum defluvii]